MNLEAIAEEKMVVKVLFGHSKLMNILLGKAKELQSVSDRMKDQQRLKNPIGNLGELDSWYR